MGLLFNARVNTYRRPSSVNNDSPIEPWLINMRAQYVAPKKDEMVVRPYGAEIVSELKFDPNTDVKQGDIFQLIWLNGHRCLDEVTTFEFFLVARSSNAIGLAQIHCYFKGWYQ